MSESKYKITKHAQTRYSERIIGNSDPNSVNKFIVEHQDKIQNDITKMIEYGILIYQGKQPQKDGKVNMLDVFLKDTWIVLVDSKTFNVVTLYKIDLGCGDDFNLQYIEKMMEKLNSKKQSLEDAKVHMECDNSTYRELMNEAQSQINTYKSMIKNLENMVEGYKLIIENNQVSVSQANMEVAECVNTLIGKKEF